MSPLCNMLVLRQHQLFCTINKLNTVSSKTAVVNSEERFLMSILQTEEQFPVRRKEPDLTNRLHSVQKRTRRRLVVPEEVLNEIVATLETSKKNHWFDLHRKRQCLYRQYEMQQNCCICIHKKQLCLWYRS